MTKWAKYEPNYDHNYAVTTLSVHEAKARFSEVLRLVEGGETVIVTRHNTPVVEIKPLNPTLIKLGAFEGEFETPDTAFGPLTNEEMKEWYGE